MCAALGFYSGVCSSKIRYVRRAAFRHCQTVFDQCFSLGKAGFTPTPTPTPLDAAPAEPPTPKAPKSGLPSIPASLSSAPPLADNYIVDDLLS